MHHRSREDSDVTYNGQTAKTPEDKAELFNKYVCSMFAACKGGFPFSGNVARSTFLARFLLSPLHSTHLYLITAIQKEVSRKSRSRDIFNIFNTTAVWQAFRDVRNQLKIKIKEAKKSFVNKAFSSSKPKEIWRVIHRVLNPSPQPLRVDVDELNEFFASTAQRTTGNGEIDVKEDLLSFVDSLQPSVSDDAAFHLRQVTLSEVLREIKGIRSDTSTGPDQLPSRYLKIVAEYIAGPPIDR